MLKFIQNIINKINERSKTQEALNLLINLEKKKLIKVKLPKEYIAMIEVLALYGITDSIQLLDILKKNESIE